MVSAEADTRSGPAPRGPGGRPSRLQSAELSDRILDVATTLFLGQGYGATSIEAVAREARVSKRTLYHRFRGKEALFEAVVRRLLDRWGPALAPNLPERASLADTLEQTAETMLRAALTPEALALHRMAIAEGGRFPGFARILHDLGAAAGVERIAQLIERRIEAAEIRPVDAKFAAEQFIMMVVTVPRRHALGLGAPFNQSELRRWIRLTVELFLAGCQT